MTGHRRRGHEATARSDGQGARDVLARTQSAGASLIRNLLFDTVPWDVPTLAGVGGLLAASAFLASYVPARRAASVNPITALRAE